MRLVVGVLVLELSCQGSISLDWGLRKIVWGKSFKLILLGTPSVVYSVARRHHSDRFNSRVGHVAFMLFITIVLLLIRHHRRRISREQHGGSTGTPRHLEDAFAASVGHVPVPPPTPNQAAIAIFPTNPPVAQVRPGTFKRDDDSMISQLTFGIQVCEVMTQMNAAYFRYIYPENERSIRCVVMWG